MSKHNGDLNIYGDLSLGDGALISGGNFFYLRGNSEVDGSVRISSPSEGVASLQALINGEWVNITLN